MLQQLEKLSLWIDAIGLEQKVVEYLQKRGFSISENFIPLILEEIKRLLLPTERK